MIWAILQEIGFFIILVFTFYFVKSRKYIDLLVLYFVGLVFATCCKFFITIWTPDKVVSMGMLYCIIFRKNDYFNYKQKQLRIIFIILIILLIISTLVAMVSIPKYRYLISPNQRLILSDFSYLSSSIVLFYGMLLPPNFKNEFFGKYCRVMEIAIITGLIHYIFNLVGIEFMPIRRAGMLEDTSAEEVLAEFGGHVISRVYGFAGEPKGLAFCILPYIVISFVMYLRGRYIRNKLYHLFFLFFGAFVLFQTYSSSALITAMLIIPIALIFGGNKSNIKVLFVLFVGLGVMLIENSLFNNTESFTDSLNKRTFERGMYELGNDRQETVIMNSFIEEGLFVKLFGWGIGQYTFNVPGQVFNNSILIPVQSGLILTLSDFGLCGMILFLYIFIVIIGLIRRANLLKNPVILSFAIASLTKMVEATMHGNIVSSFIYLMIASYMLEDEKYKLYGKR